MLTRCDINLRITAKGAAKLLILLIIILGFAQSQAPALTEGGAEAEAQASALAKDGAKNGAKDGAGNGAKDGAEAESVLLTVYIYDRCGGCGDNNPGCGECVETLRYHGIINEQLGDRLYGGPIVYRLFNCRLDAHEEARVTRGKSYGVPESLLHIRPMIYIGDEAEGVYLPGEALIAYAGEMLDRYVAGESMESIRNDIMDIYNERESG
jgi:hypothetical protein